MARNFPLANEEVFDLKAGANISQPHTFCHRQEVVNAPNEGMDIRLEQTRETLNDNGDWRFILSRQ